jgi:hypothetical protein
MFQIELAEMASTDTAATPRPSELNGEQFVTPSGGQFVAPTDGQFATQFVTPSGGQFVAPTDGQFGTQFVTPSGGGFVTPSGRQFVTPSGGQFQGNDEAVFVIITTLQSVLILCIFCGNGLVLASVWRYRKLRTMTNYFLVSLAVTDILYGASAPFMLFGVLQNSKVACQVTIGIITVCLETTVFNLLCLAVDRLIAIVWPLRYATIVTRKRVLCIKTLVWISAIGITALLLSNIGTEPWDIDIGCGFGSVPYLQIIAIAATVFWQTKLMKQLKDLQRSPKYSNRLQNQSAPVNQKMFHDFFLGFTSMIALIWGRCFRLCSGEKLAADRNRRVFSMPGSICIGCVLSRDLLRRVCLV